MHWADWALIILFGGMGALFLALLALVMWKKREANRLIARHRQSSRKDREVFEGQHAGGLMIDAEHCLTVGHQAGYAVSTATNCTFIRTDPDEADTPSSKRK